MIGLVGLAAALAAAAPVLDPDPSDATLIYYNARIALREGRPADVTRWWLLRNAHREVSGRVSPYDADFGSVTWAALGALGVCQDGHPRDHEGAGLWPLAMHNQVVVGRQRRPRGEGPRPFRTFDIDRQQRLISIDDVLDAEELRTFDLVRSGLCLGPRVVMAEVGELPWTSLRDRHTATKVLAWLLERARSTLAPAVEGRAAIDARLFDVHLQLIELAAIEARRRARSEARLGRSWGLNRASAQEHENDAKSHSFADDSAPANILRRASGWSPADWMALSPERRLFLYDHMVRYLGDGPERQKLALALIDEMAARGQGAEVQDWIARRQVADRPAMWGGERGLRLLKLDPSTGFTERSTLALHRGVDALEKGDLDAALRSFSLAVRHAHESSEGDTVHALGLRWLSYTASRFVTDDTLIVTLQELLPAREFAIILEDLLWSAALRADRASFEAGLARQPGRGALERRIGALGPLARGDAARFVREIEAGMRDNPGETQRWLDQYVQRLEREEVEVREGQRRILEGIRRLLEPYADPALAGRSARKADALLRRTLAIVEGLGAPPDPALRDQARRLRPDAEVYAGSVRLAPSDPLPWPFTPSQPKAPDVLEPLRLIPVERRSPEGEWVLTWRIEG